MFNAMGLLLDLSKRFMILNRPLFTRRRRRPVNGLSPTKRVMRRYYEQYSIFSSIGGR